MGGRGRLQAAEDGREGKQTQVTGARAPRQPHAGGARHYPGSVTADLTQQLRSLPASPGVYLFRGEHEAVLYVGKAKTLRSRVRSYFNAGGDQRPGIDQLVARVHRVEVIVTRTEAEALHLEQNLVKRHRPPFNIRLRDDKSYPYIAVTVGDEFPRVVFTRERHRRGKLYFGPYASAKRVRETLDVLNRVFQFRPCEGPRPGRHSGVPCLDFHIERCVAPCIGAVSVESYRALIDGVIAFLEGDTRTIAAQLTDEMRRASAEERFEDAARYRNRLFAIESLAQRQAADRRDVGTADVLGLAIEGENAVVQVFPLRDGKLVDRHSFHLENVAGQDRATVLESFALEYYGASHSIPALVIVPPDLTETAALQDYLTAIRGAVAEVRAPQRGEKRRLAELAEENARLGLERDTTQTLLRRQRRFEALEQLREALNLESLPARIECFDVSNTQGREIVASMAVALDGQPRSALYRSFTIRGLEQQDDFAAINQAVTRRFERLRDAAIPSRADASFSSTPNLIVIDGGRGQLAAALAAMRATGDWSRIAVIALAKREEEIFLPGSSTPVRLDPHDPGLQLLQRVRDEAHRFALDHHRRRRGAQAMGSIFDGLVGVGPARRRAILRHFGSAEAFLAAEIEQLEAVPGLPAKTARSIHAQLHRAGGASS